MTAVILVEWTRYVHDAVDYDPRVLDHGVALDLVPANQPRAVIRIGGWIVRAHIASARGLQLAYEPVEPPSRASRGLHIGVGTSVFFRRVG